MITLFDSSIPFNINLSSDITLFMAVAILLLTVFLGFGMIFFGSLQRKRLKRSIRIPAVIEKIYYPSFEASISWTHMGITHYQACFGVYALTKKDKLWVLHNPAKYTTIADIWTHNGKGLILSGAIISFLTGLALYLLVVFS